MIPTLLLSGSYLTMKMAHGLGQGPLVLPPLSQGGVRVQSLIGELGFCKPQAAAKKKKKQNQTEVPLRQGALRPAGDERCQCARPTWVSCTPTQRPAVHDPTSSGSHPPARWKLGAAMCQL